MIIENPTENADLYWYVAVTIVIAPTAKTCRISEYFGKRTVQNCHCSDGLFGNRHEGNFITKKAPHFQVVPLSLLPTYS